jgi:hypothetical protein
VAIVITLEAEAELWQWWGVRMGFCWHQELEEYSPDHEWEDQVALETNGGYSVPDQKAL